MSPKVVKFKVTAGCVMWLLAALTAFAEPSDSSIEQAKRFMELGQEAFNKRDFDEAAKQFVAAYTASPFSAFLYNAGLAYERGGDTDNAIDLYRRYLEVEPEAKDYVQVELKIKSLLAAKKAPQAGEDKTAPAVAITGREMKSLISVRTNPSDAKVRVLDPDGKEVSSVVGQLAQTVEKGRYTIEASHPSYRTVTTDVSVASGQVYVVVVEMSQGAFLGFLRVVTDIPGASVYIDDKSEGSMGETPFGNVVPTGEHKLIVEKPGYTPIEQEIEINVGDKKEINLTLERLSFGALVVKTNQADAKVFVNEKPVGTVPLKGELSANLPAGLHTVRASAEGMKDYTVQVKINGGQSTKLLVRFNPTPSRTSAWVSLGFSAALFIGGGVLGGFALHDRKELDAERRSGTLASDDDRIIRAFLFGLGADVSFGIGTLVGGLSIYYFLRDPLPPSEGKKLIPVDFEENPPPGSAPKRSPGKTKATTPSSSEKTGVPPSDAKLTPRFFIAPLFGTTHAGLGLSVAF